jgi:hypothetical protein
LFADALVEVNIVFLINIVLISQPQSFIGVDEIPLPNFALNFFCLLFLRFLFDFKIIIYHFWHFRSCFFNFLLFVHIDWEINKF